MWNKTIRWIASAVFVAGVTGVFGVAGSCGGAGTTASTGFGSKDLTDAGIIGLQGDLETNCGGFGCGFDFTSDF